MIGNLSDIALVDLMRFVHLDARTGTLVLKRDHDLAHITFHRGHIVSAWGPTSMSVCELLVKKGALLRSELDAIAAEHAALVHPVPLGQMLVTSGTVTPESLREAITHKVERTLLDLIGWTRGSFRFDLEEVRGDQEIALVPSDVLPLEPVAQLVQTIHLVTEDIELVARFGARVAAGILVRTIALSDAGTPAPGERAPLVLLDMRAGLKPLSVERLRKQHSRSFVVAIVAPGVDPSGLYAAGVAAVVPPEATSIAACCGTLLAVIAQAFEC